MFESAFKAYPDRPAYTNMGTSMSFRQLDQLSMQFACYLQQELGLTRGERVAIMLPNILQYPVALCGIFRAGLAAFTKLFTDKYAADNIRMNNVLPGFIDSLPESEERRSRIPLGRYGRVHEVSELIAFLASDRSSYITGQNIRIDGGITRSV